jgi:hypothetical protein
LHLSTKLSFFNYQSYWLRDSNVKLGDTARSLLHEIKVRDLQLRNLSD